MGAIKNRCQSGTFRKEMEILLGNQGRLLSKNWPILPFLQYVQKKTGYNKLKHNENGVHCDNFCRLVKDTAGLDGQRVDNRQPNPRCAQCQQRVGPPLAGWGVRHFTFERTLWEISSEITDAMMLCSSSPICDPSSNPRF